MGFSQSRFHDAVSRGNQTEAYALYFQKKAIRDGTQPNSPLGTGPSENSALHYAALFAMKQLYMDLVNKGGKPDMKNKQRQNCLHLICRRAPIPHVRTDMLRFTLEAGLYGMDLEHVLEEKDEEGNTALHLAAAVGLKDCVETLVNAGANLFLTNDKEETAADLATKGRYPDIATALETKMVFNPDEDHTAPVDPDPDLLREIAEAPTGMKDEDIRSMKDQLLIETTQLLGVSLFTAEALLRNYGWSKERLLNAWMADPLECCEKSGVGMPTDLTADNLDHPPGATALPEVMDKGGGAEEAECGICTMPCPKAIQVPCEHTFCRECWKQYLHSKIESGEAHNIQCPEYGCYKLVPVEVIGKVVSKEMEQKFLHYDIKAFVESNPQFRWCPHPGCGQAVSMAPFEEATPFSPGAMETRQPILTVHCGNDHYFCWSCGGQAHNPCDCEQWQMWLDHIEEMKPKIGDTTSAEADEAASSKWLAVRSKPCPKCKAPIEKTEGCNHMCCRKCKHDFCWVCLDVWKCHNSSTGGYFECNRYDAKKKADHMLTARKEKVMSGYEEVEKVSRFLHYYERYKAHGDSLELEAPYLDKARHKMVELYTSVQKMDMPRGSISAGTLDMSFIEEAVKELLRARRVLQASYAFGYYVKGNTPRRYFENLQGALEEVTEMLAEVVARPHLRKPRAEIIRLTREAREKRVYLCKNVKKLPSPSPQLRRRFDWLPHIRSDDDSSDSQSDSTSNAVLFQLLEDLGRHQRTSQDQDRSDDIQRALEISRQEYEEERQIKEAIALSMRDEEQSSDQGSRDAAAATALEPSLPWLFPHPFPQVPPNPLTRPELSWLEKMETEDIPTLDLSSRSPDAGTAGIGGNLYHDLMALENTPPDDGDVNPAHYSPTDHATLCSDPMYYHPGATDPSPMNDLSCPRGTDPKYGHKQTHTSDSHRSHVNTFTPFYSNLNRASLSMLPRDSNMEDSLSSPSSNGDPVGYGDSVEGCRVSSAESDGEEGFGPVYGEEEDLRRAIELSLMKQQSNHDTAAASENMMTVSGPQFEDSNRLAEQSSDDPPLLNLPPELRHLLQGSSHRTGEHV